MFRLLRALALLAARRGFAVAGADSAADALAPLPGARHGWNRGHVHGSTNRFRVALVDIARVHHQPPPLLYRLGRFEQLQPLQRRFEQIDRIAGA